MPGCQIIGGRAPGVNKEEQRVDLVDDVPGSALLILMYFVHCPLCYSVKAMQCFISGALF